MWNEINRPGICPSGELLWKKRQWAFAFHKSRQLFTRWAATNYAKKTSIYSKVLNSLWNARIPEVYTCMREWKHIWYQKYRQGTIPHSLKKIKSHSALDIVTSRTWSIQSKTETHHICSRHQLLRKLRCSFVNCFKISFSSSFLKVILIPKVSCNPVLYIKCFPRFSCLNVSLFKVFCSK